MRKQSVPRLLFSRSSTKLQLFLAVLCLHTSAIGQTNRGAISVVVADSTKAVVANAEVQCRNTGTTRTTVSKSSTDGEFTFQALDPGEYQITVEAPGFKRVQSGPVRVYVGDVTRVDMELQVGAVTETVQVGGSAALVQPDSSEASTVLTGAEYDNLPLAAASRLRIPTDFALSVPGVLGSQARPGQSLTATTSLSIDGSADSSVDVLVDGMSSGQIQSFGSFTEMAIPVDAIQEFNVIKGAFSAEYGYVRTGLISFSLKSGTNQLRADLFESFRNDALNARSFFAGPSLPYHQNNFGGTVGGPVVIPHLYNGKNRTFFMASSDNSFFRGTSQVVVYTSPTAAMVRGDFSGVLMANGKQQVIYDPASTALNANGGYTRNPFPNNVIPANQIDPIAAKVAALYPAPNMPGSSSNYLGRGGATFLNDYSFNTKVDHRITDRHTLSFSYNVTYIPRLTDSNPYENTPLWNGLNQTFGSNVARLSYTAILTPSTLNSFQVGINRWIDPVRSLSYSQDWPNKLGVKGVGGDGTLPVFAFLTDGYSQVSSTRWDSNLEQNFQLRNTTALTRGRHNLKVGFEMRKQHVKTRNWDNQNGTFSFSSAQTSLNGSSSTGNAFASFLLGSVNRGSISTPVEADSRRPYYAAFVQDDIKVNSRLTLNLGLRYDLDLAPFEQYDRASIFDLNTPNPAAGNIPGALVFLGSGPGRIGRRAYEETHKTNFAPRAGLAYQINQKTVFRAGYALSYASNGLVNSNLGFTQTANFVDLTQGASPIFLLSSGMPTNYPRPPFIDPAFGNGNNVTTSISSEAARMPQTHLWRGEVQRELPGGILLEAAYVGTRGLQLTAPGLRNFNQTPAADLSLGSLLSADINSAAAQSNGIRLPYPGFTGPVRQALRPYPQVLTISSAADKIGSSMYHALEAKLQKRFSSGLQFLVSYTFSHNMTDVQSALAGIASSPGIQDAANRRAEWAVAGFDTPHNISINTIYELPFGPGKRFLSHTGLAGSVLGGWSISGILTYQSGLPLTITQTNSSLLFTTAQRPNLVPGVNGRNSIGYSDFDPATDRLFNPAAFAASAANSFGNAPPRLADVRDYGIRNENVALRRAFVIREKAHFEFNAQAFNIFNRPEWGSPSNNLSNANFGKIATAGPGRFLQLGLKLNF
jgi:hypothetical protein